MLSVIDVGDVAFTSFMKIEALAAVVVAEIAPVVFTLRFVPEEPIPVEPPADKLIFPAPEEIAVALALVMLPLLEVTEMVPPLETSLLNAMSPEAVTLIVPVPDDTSKIPAVIVPAVALNVIFAFPVVLIVLLVFLNVILPVLLIKLKLTLFPRVSVPALMVFKSFKMIDLLVVTLMLLVCAAKLPLEMLPTMPAVMVGR